MREPHYLHGTSFDADDYAAEVAKAAAQAPANEGGLVFVNWLDLDDDLWTASWERGDEHASATGTRAEMVAWAIAQPSARRWVFDASLGDFAPLSD